MKCFTICVVVVCSLAALVRADDDLVAAASENAVNAQEELSGSASSLSPLTEKHQEKRYVGGYTGVGGYGTGLDSTLGYGTGSYGAGGYGAGAYGAGGYGAGGYGAGAYGAGGYGAGGYGAGGYGAGGYGAGGYGAGAGAGGYGAGGYGAGGYGGYSQYNTKLGLEGGYAGYPGYSGYSGGSSGYPSYSNSYYNRAGAYPYSRASYGYNSYPSSYYSGGYGSSIVGGGLGALGTPAFAPPVAGAGYQYGPGITGTVY